MLANNSRATSVVHQPFSAPASYAAPSSSAHHHFCLPSTSSQTSFECSQLNLGEGEGRANGNGQIQINSNCTLLSHIPDSGNHNGPGIPKSIPKSRSIQQWQHVHHWPATAAFVHPCKFQQHIEAGTPIISAKM
jgi:hypothetical protein